MWALDKNKYKVCTFLMIIGKIGSYEYISCATPYNNKAKTTNNVSKLFMNIELCGCKL
jgi:hypothetical protein